MADILRIISKGKSKCGMLKDGGLVEDVRRWCDVGGLGLCVWIRFVCV